MRCLFLLAAAGLVVSAVPAGASGLQMREQDRAYRAMQRGRILSLPEIRSRIRVRGAQYIGAEVIGDNVYRLKYMRGPEVIWIDVDARTGEVIGKSGH